MADKPNKSKIPPIIISHNEGGDFIMGAEDVDVTRKRDIGLYSSKADNRLRFYRDGGFELHSSRDENSENLKMGSAIVQDCINAPLHIISNGDIHVSCAGTFSVDASRIVLKSNAVNETGINIDAEADVRIQAGRDYLVTADNITIDAVHWWHGADAATGEDVAAHLMGYDVVSDNSSNSGNLSNGTVLADAPNITNAGHEQIYYQSMTVQSADVDAGKVILFTFASDTVNSDYTINATVIYHI